MTPSNTLPCLKVPCFIGWGSRGTATPLALGNPKGGAALADGIQWRAEPFLAGSIRENRDSWYTTLPSGSPCSLLHGVGAKFSASQPKPHRYRYFYRSRVLCGKMRILRREGSVNPAYYLFCGAFRLHSTRGCVLKSAGFGVR